MFSFTASIFEPLYLTTFTSAESGISPASLARLYPMIICALSLSYGQSIKIFCFSLTTRGKVLFSFFTTVTAAAAISLSVALLVALPTVDKALFNEKLDSFQSKMPLFSFNVRILLHPSSNLDSEISPLLTASST